MQKLTLVAGSTGELSYTPENPADVTNVAVELYDADGVAVETTTLTNGLDDVWRCFIAHDDIPVSAIGEEWSGAFIVTLVIDGEAQYRRKPFTVDILDDANTALTVTVGTNSYVTLDEADAYMANRVGMAAWDDANAYERSAALLMAARRVDSLRFRGIKYDEEQTMQFPRVMWGQGQTRYSEEHERYSAMSNVAGWIGDDVVPQAVKDAQCEEALAIVATADEDVDRISMQAQGVTAVRIGEFSESYGNVSGSSLSSSAIIRSSDALSFLKPWLAGTVRIA
jgi:hypothetical protein